MISFTDNPIAELREGMPFVDYCAFPAVNQSRLKDIDYSLGGCPALFRYRCDHPDDGRNSDALALGRRYHSYLLEPDAFEQLYAVMTPEVEQRLYEAALADKSKAKGFSENLTTFKAWKREQIDAGREVVSVDAAEQLKAMRYAVASDPDIMEIIGMGKTEVSAFCGYTLQTGEHFQLKARFDLLPGGDALVDLKTARTAEARKFASQVYDLGYDLQAAFYIDVARRNKLKIERFGFLAQDKFPPYLPCIHWLPADWIVYGRSRYIQSLYKLAECIRTNRWPGRISGELEPPAWAKSEIEAVN